MKSPKVSIIIPNYNHVQYLEERIESVLNQTYQNFEIILLDDSSTDSSLEILSRYESHAKVSHFEVNQQNSGSVFKQWVKGIKLAKGEYIWIAESDDVAHFEFLEETSFFLNQNTEFALVFCYSIEIDNKSLETGKFLGPIKEKKDFIISGKRLVAKNLISKLVIGNASSVLFRKSAFKYVDFDRLIKFNNTGDRYTYIKMGLNSPLYYLNKPLNFYRNHSQNTTKKNNLNNSIFYDRISIVNEMIPVLKNDEKAKQYLLEFYFKSVFKYLDVIPISINQNLVVKFRKNNYFDKSTSFRILFYNRVIFLFKKRFPHKLRVVYKNLIFNKLKVDI
jgi:glycosyltransferase involved in cell wall biosynthesis